MSFEQILRNRIAKAPFKSREKEILKVVLGEVQQKTVNVTDEMGYNIIKSMIKNNVEKVLPYLKDGDLRRAPVLEENAILDSMLPQYLTLREIVDTLMCSDELCGQIREAKSEGQAMGMAMKFLKADNATVEGDTVKLAVQQLRA